jgi:protein SCO1/2
VRAVHPRVRLVLIGVFACGFAAVIGVWIAAYRDAGDSTLQRSADAGLHGFIRPAGARVPEYALRDQDGRPATPRDHAGDTTVYAFIYSTCEDVCPLEVQQIRGALDDLGRDLPVVGVSVDPATDTPRLAKRFLVKQRMTGRMRFLLGSRAELAPVWRAFGIQPQTDGKDHSAYVVVVDRQGRQRLGYPVSQLSVDGLARDLAKLDASA